MDFLIFSDWFWFFWFFWLAPIFLILSIFHWFYWFSPRKSVKLTFPIFSDWIRFFLPRPDYFTDFSLISLTPMKTDFFRFFPIFRFIPENVSLGQRFHWFPWFPRKTDFSVFPDFSDFPIFSDLISLRPGSCTDSELASSESVYPAAPPDRQIPNCTESRFPASVGGGLLNYIGFYRKMESCDSSTFWPWSRMFPTCLL